MKNILIELRVKHYFKNILVFLPLVFSLNLSEIGFISRTVLVFIAFCAGSSAVYVLNDIADIDRDRLHPRKKNRPIASGAISVRSGIIMTSVCAVIAACLALYAGITALALLIAYLIMNILYSFVLKKYALIDVFVVMAGFLIRVGAGASAINVPVSAWLMLTIMSLSLFLGFGKRRGEMRMEHAAPKGATRGALLQYDPAFLERAMYSMMTLSAVFYALWAINAETITRVGSGNLIWTVPLVLAGLLRYAQCLEAGISDGDPTNVLYSDKPLLCVMGVYAAAVVFIIYFLP